MKLFLYDVEDGADQVIVNAESVEDAYRVYRKHFPGASPREEVQIVRLDNNLWGKFAAKVK